MNKFAPKFRIMARKRFGRECGFQAQCSTGVRFNGQPSWENLGGELGTIESAITEIYHFLAEQSEEWEVVADDRRVRELLSEIYEEDFRGILGEASSD